MLKTTDKTRSHRKQTISSLNKIKDVSLKNCFCCPTLCRWHGSTMWCVRGFLTFPDLFYRVTLRIPCNRPFNFTELSSVIIFTLRLFFSNDSFSPYEMADVTLVSMLNLQRAATRKMLFIWLFIFGTK